MGFVRKAVCKALITLAYVAVVSWLFRWAYVYAVEFFELADGSGWQIFTAILFLWCWGQTAFWGVLVLVIIPLEDFPGAGLAAWLRAWPERKGQLKRQRELVRQEEERKRRAELHFENLKADPQPKTWEDFRLLFPNCCEQCGSRDFVVQHITHFFGVDEGELLRARERVFDDKSKAECAMCEACATNLQPYQVLTQQEIIQEGDGEVLLEMLTENSSPILRDPEGKLYVGYPKKLTDTFKDLIVRSKVRAYSPHLTFEQSEQIPDFKPVGAPSSSP